MYNVVDQFCAGRFISETALAALTISFPVFFILVAVSHGIYAGGTALVSNALGEGQTEKALHFTGQVIAAALMASVAVMVLGWAISPWLFRVLGAEGAYLKLALDYMNVIFAGTSLFLLASMLNVPLMARGNTRVFRNSLIAGFIMNAVLDPLFIFAGYGLKGVAFATVLIQGINAIYIGYRGVRAGYLSRSTFREMIPDRQCQLELLKYSVPASLNMATVAIGIFVTTYFVSGYGVTATAAYGVAMRVEQIALLPTIGLNIATLSIVGQNYGAGQMARIRETIKVAIRYGFYICLIGGGLLLLVGGWVIDFFVDANVVADAERVVAEGTIYLRFAAGLIMSYVVLFVVVNALQGMKRPYFAIWIGLYRQFLAPVVLIYVLSQVWGWELYGVWWGIFLSTWSGAFIAWWYGNRVVSKLERQVKPG
jgi:putative MATE family efflux protein